MRWLSRRIVHSISGTLSTAPVIVRHSAGPSSPAEAATATVAKNGIWRAIKMNALNTTHRTNRNRRWSNRSEALSGPAPPSVSRIGPLPWPAHHPNRVSRGRPVSSAPR